MKLILEYFRFLAKSVSTHSIQGSSTYSNPISLQHFFSFSGVKLHFPKSVSIIGAGGA